LEEEIDLRPYLAALVKNWYWILGTGAVAALVALLISSLLPPTYEATALVAITRPRYVLQFDSRFQNVSNIQPVYRAYPELATSDGILQELRQANDNLTRVETLTELRQTLSASAGADPSLIRLSVKGRDPQNVATLANSWADIYVQRANELFGNQNGEQVTFFTTQLALAATELERAQQALIAFQGENRSTILETQLRSHAETQAAYLARQWGLALLLEDVEGLKRQLAALPPDQAVTVADQLTALLLQLQAFGAGDGAMLQLSVAGQPGDAPLSAAGQAALLDGLLVAVEETAVNIDQQLAELEPLILQTQQELQQLAATQDRLSRDLSIAQETYTTLARKLEEARLTTEGVGSEVQLASYAAVPERAVSSGRLTIVLIAAFSGGLAAMLIVIAREWWQNREDAINRSVSG
jgi:polysaccharide biosynthesis transport protein